ncbi:MAG: hypothetical protein ACQEW8_07340 [Actinomycetota bacterium]
MHIKFISKYNPRNLTADVIATPEAQAAWDEILHATTETEKLNDAFEHGTAKAKAADIEYARKLADAANNGDDLSKITPPAPFDPAPIHAQAATWQERAREAAVKLGRALPKAAPTEIPRLLAELEQAEQAVAETLDRVRDAYLSVDSLTRRLVFNRQVQQYPGQLPLMDLQPNTGAIDALLIDVTKRTRQWRAHDLSVQQDLADQESRATTDTARKRELADKIHDLEVARRTALV